jgi:hypothetical protein
VIGVVGNAILLSQFDLPDSETGLFLVNLPALPVIQFLGDFLVRATGGHAELYILSIMCLIGPAGWGSIAVAAGWLRRRMVARGTIV